MCASLDPSFRLNGWIELNGERLSENEVRSALSQGPGIVSGFGGEFVVEWNGCIARDHFGIIAGQCPPGVAICKTREIARINPPVPAMCLDEAIEVAVRLRSDEGAVAFSGGVDSALVAKLSGRECIVVGMEGAHDLRRARQVADEARLTLHQAIVDPTSVESALRRVLQVIPKIDPVNASIATTLYFVAMEARSRGHRRILAGQGADELFGGYSRYLHTCTLGEDLERDFQGLALQLARDQAVAALFGTYFSLPYMDLRVVRAARAIPPEMKVCQGIRKKPLRDAAERHLPALVARYDKKAMQYGSGMMKEILKLASKRGYRKSLQEFMEKIAREEGREI